MAGDDSWIRAEMGGTSRASVIGKPEVIGALLNRVKRPIIIVGHEVAISEPDCEAITGFISTVSRIRHIPVLGTSPAVKELVSNGIRIEAIMGGMEIADRLRDPEWKGFDNLGQYDLVLFAAIPYSFCWTILSGLRNSAPHLKTINLDRKYQPHATWSFGNIAVEPWKKHLQAAAVLLEKGEEHV
ncbi:MAG TPA: carbon monoxide dehydrogenase beta subunit family protein [Methanospirillum sp.]|uniref:carbon monoxide dehydrogenase beta subunit family protein n=1 Tax=Methanospirillum sp. TaxID=45200 RepID=UPI002C9EE805|nr:carbon monoxide dehydrogenase beta subunit family protein [Methanospirillum sp.]HWQ64224.1 carbon monoxide dehydrogenase beta subunit family protein [Methanospirillum sp.]